MSSTNYDPLHPVRAAKGLVMGGRAAAHGIRATDGEGNEVFPAAEIRIRGMHLTEPEDNVAEYGLGGSGHDGSSGTGLGITDMLNNAGVDLVLYDVVVVDETEDNAVTTTTTPQDTRLVGICQADIAAGEVGPVLFGDWTPGVHVDGAVTRGDYLETSSTPGVATTNPTRRDGSFAVLTTGGDPADTTLEAELLIDSETSATGAAASSLTVLMPATRPGGMVAIAKVRVGSGSIAVAMTGWTQIGANNQFTYFYRVTDEAEPASYAATWSGSHRAIAIVAILDLLDTASPIAASAFDATSAAAAIAGLADAYYAAIAGVDSVVDPVDAGWTSAGDESTSGTVGSTTDLNLAATVTSGGTTAFTSPANANDNNNATVATRGAGVGVVLSYLQTDLGAAYLVADMELLETSGPFTYAPYYSTDGVTWHLCTSQVLTLVGTGRYHYAFDAVTARYFRLVDDNTGGGFYPAITWATWQVLGVASEAPAGTLAYQVFSGTGVTSPFPGSLEAVDAVIALNLRTDPFVGVAAPAAILFGVPDLVDPTSVPASGDGIVPYLIDVGETFTVPIKKQAPYAIPIDVNGTLAVNGILVEVD